MTEAHLGIRPGIAALAVAAAVGLFALSFTLTYPARLAEGMKVTAGSFIVTWGILLLRDIHGTRRGGRVVEATLFLFALGGILFAWRRFG